MGAPQDLNKEGITQRRARARFLVIGAGVLVAGLAGYVGFVALVGTDRGTAAGTLVLAAATGFAAFFSPCSFPLMLTFLTRQATASRKVAAVSALLVAVGAASLLALVTLLLVLGGKLSPEWSSSTASRVGSSALRLERC